MRSWMKGLVLLGAALVILSAWPATADDDVVTLPVRFRSFMVNMWSMRARAGTLDIVVNNWTPAAETERLASMIDQNGALAAVDALEKMPKMGYLQVPGYLGLDVQYTRMTPGPEKTVDVLIVAERLMRFSEMANDTISTDYPLTVAELQIKPNGEGVGMLYPIARINYWDMKTQLAAIDSLTPGINLPTVKMLHDVKTKKKK